MKTTVLIAGLVLLVPGWCHPGKEPFAGDLEDFLEKHKELTIEEAEYVDVENKFDEEVEKVQFKAVEEEPQPETRVLYTGSQLWKAVVNDDPKRKVIIKLRENKDISTWGGNTTSLDILVKYESLEKAAEELNKNGIPYKVVIDDLQRAIDEENPPVSEEYDELENRRGHRLTWQAYHRLNDIHGYLSYMADTYPDLCSIYSIGKSHEGRDLKVLKISNGKSGNKAIWIDGGIHAREWISPASVTYIINHLVLNHESEPKDVRDVDFYFLPVANPDGYEYSHTTDRLWRKNRARRGVGTCAGTDLNRNYGYKWGGRGNGKIPCQEIYGGAGPFSEPETKAIQHFITQTNRANWKASISFHSYGQYILYPWGYDRVVPPDHKDLEIVARKAANAITQTSGASYTIGPAANTLYPASGGSDDWAKGVVGMKYAYTIELRDQGQYGFVLPASYIQPTAKEALAALRVIAQAAAAA